MVSSWKMPLAYPNPPFFPLRGLSWHQKRCSQAFCLPAMGQGRHLLMKSAPSLNVHKVRWIPYGIILTLMNRPPRHVQKTKPVEFIKKHQFSCKSSPSHHVRTRDKRGVKSCGGGLVQGDGCTRAQGIVYAVSIIPRRLSGVLLLVLHTLYRQAQRST